MKNKRLEYLATLTSPDIQDIKTLEDKIKQRTEIRYDINSTQKSLVNEIKFMENNTVCPTCNQDISEEFRSHVTNCNNIKLDEIVIGVDKIDNQLKKFNDKLTEYKNIENDIKTVNGEIVQIDMEISNRNRNIEMLESNIEKMISNMNESLDLEDDSVYKEELEVLMAQYNDAIFQKEVLTEVSKMLKDDGAKSDVIKRYIPRMNKIINDYLSEFDLYVNFVLDENFDEKILSRYRDNFSYKSFSQGEKLRINLAIMLAWKEIAKEKNAISTNLLILDETLDGALDDAGVSDLIKSLRNLEGERNNVFVISHRGDGLKDLFDSHISFNKIKNFSIMETLN